MIAAIIFLMLYGMDIGIYLIKHGEPKEGRYNIWHELIALSINITLLYFAGFFNVFK